MSNKKKLCITVIVDKPAEELIRDILINVYGVLRDYVASRATVVILDNSVDSGTTAVIKKVVEGPYTDVDWMYVDANEKDLTREELRDMSIGIGPDVQFYNSFFVSEYLYQYNYEYIVEDGVGKWKDILKENGITRIDRPYTKIVHEFLQFYPDNIDLVGVIGYKNVKLIDPEYFTRKRDDFFNNIKITEVSNE